MSERRKREERESAISMKRKRGREKEGVVREMGIEVDDQEMTCSIPSFSLSLFAPSPLLLPNASLSLPPISASHLIPRTQVLSPFNLLPLLSTVSCCCCSCLCYLRFSSCKFFFVSRMGGKPVAMASVMEIKDDETSLLSFSFRPDQKNHSHDHPIRQETVQHQPSV